ncbi:MAG: hypothetical protein ABIK99_05745 [candidate division WOR-3 bacterium]
MILVCRLAKENGLIQRRVLVYFSLTFASMFADSLNCREIGSRPFGSSYAVALDPNRNLAFLGSGCGTYLINLSNPSQPRKRSVAIHTRGFVQGIWYQSNRLFIAAGQAGLEIRDAGNPATLAFLSRYNTPGDAFGVAVVGKYAYVANYDARLRVIEFYGGLRKAQRQTPSATIFRNILFLPAVSGKVSGTSICLLSLCFSSILYWAPI